MITKYLAERIASFITKGQLMSISVFRPPIFGGKVEPANPNQKASRVDWGKLEGITKSETKQPEASGSAWYHDAAIMAELGPNRSKKR
jgi:hypothetical protein